MAIVKAVSAGVAGNAEAGANQRGIVSAEKSTSVITMFEAIIEQTVNEMLARTAPLRKRLQAQNETGPPNPR
jgi:hypothetical protein